MFNFLVETFKMGAKNLRLHKLRSLLTALGIILGVASIIVMVAIGEGGKQAAVKQLQKLGANNIVIRSVRPVESNDASQRGSRTLNYGITRADLSRLSTIPGIARIVPMRNTEQNVSYGAVRATSASPIGTTPQVFDVVRLRLARGILFGQTHYDRAEPVCVIGDTVARQLFPYKDPLGEVLQVGSSGSTVMLKIIGVLEPAGLRSDTGNSIIDRDMDADLYVPQTAIARAFGDNIVRRQAGTFERKTIELSEIWVQVADGTDVETVAGAVSNILNQNHPSQDVNVKVPMEILRSAEQVNRIFNLIMVGTASISLIVGGIGIMNIMLATVTERTREIGIRRALGAKQRHITLQFLIETTLISATGGLLGIAIGCASAMFVPVFARWLNSEYPTSITTWSVVTGFLISAMTGIFFGLYPALSAARMNPIDALRHE